MMASAPAGRASRASSAASRLLSAFTPATTMRDGADRRARHLDRARFSARDMT
jgi:hypothetical protein